MTDEVYTDCPACGEEIPFYRTVDELKACPECGTPTGTPQSPDPEPGETPLFDIADSEPIEPAEPVETTLDLEAAMTDGGVERDE